MTITLSSKGQITVPIEIRKALALRPGIKLRVRLGQTGEFIVSKEASESVFAKFRGVARRRAPWKTGDAAREALRGSAAT